MLSENKIAERVRLSRKVLGLSQTTLAQAAGVSRATVARIEAGEANSVALGTLLSVLNALSWDLSLERGVTPAATSNSFDMETYLDSLFGSAR